VDLGGGERGPADLGGGSWWRRRWIFADGSWLRATGLGGVGGGAGRRGGILEKREKNLEKIVRIVWVILGIVFSN